MHQITGRHLFLSVAIALLFVSLAAGQSAPTGNTADLDLLQGHWQGHGPGGPCTVDIEGHSLVYRQPQTDPSEPEFWYRTTFALPDASGPKQLHATILEYGHENPQDIGTVVVTIYEVGDETLRLGVVEDFKELPEEPIVGDWEWVMDLYELERAPSPAD